MYAPTAVDLGLSDGQAWPSGAHKRVAECALCFNERVTSLDTLRQGVSLINSYTEAQIRLVTVEELRRKGLPV